MDKKEFAQKMFERHKALSQRRFEDFLRSPFVKVLISTLPAGPPDVLTTLLQGAFDAFDSAGHEFVTCEIARHVADPGELS